LLLKIVFGGAFMKNVCLRYRFPAGPLVAIALAACWLSPLTAAAQAPCPSLVPTSIPPPNLGAPAATLIPSDVCIPASFGGNPIAFFDDYSWRVFIALVWPALSGQRGAPDPNQPITAANVPLVFETYKAATASGSSTSLR
jgi:hypothetical protein